MISIERSVTVDTPAADVFDLLADARNESRWNPNVVRIDKLSDGPPRRGSSFAGTYRRGGRMAFTIADYERPSRLVFRGGGRQTAVTATVRVSASRSGTTVAMRADMCPRGPLRLLEPLVRSRVERQYADVIARFRAFVTTAEEEGTMAVNGNKAIYRRWFEEVVGTGDLALADELLAPGYRLHFPGVPRPLDADGHKSLVAMFRAAFPDWAENVEDVIGEDDRVVIRVTGSGHHRGAFQGIAPTGAHVTATGVGIARIADGRIAEAWAAYDELGLLQQIGAGPPPG